MKVFTSERCDRHQSPAGYPEQASRRTAVVEGARLGGFEVVESPTDLPGLDEAVTAVHSEEYVHRLRRAVDRGDGLIDSADNPLSPGTWEGACAAVAVTLTALEVAVGGEPAFAVVRPPGHHAERDLAMGFCYLNNVAIAARHAQRAYGLDRVAILDVDVHHGNGTQHLFERDGSVFYASVHQYPFYPGTGAADGTGETDGKGATLNVPLAAGTGDDGYETALRGVVLPALEGFVPDLLLLSVGFDAWEGDPLGGMRVTAGGYEAWATWCRELADGACASRVLAVLEGGYDVVALPELSRVFCRGLAAD